MRGLITALREEQLKADCSRRRVGAVLVKDEVIIGRGHNRLPEGSCLDGQCPRGQLTYDQQPKDVGYVESGCISQHAEVAAIIDAGDDTEDAVLFVTEPPCFGCQAVIVGAKLLGVRVLNPDHIGKFQAPV